MSCEKEHGNIVKALDDRNLWLKIYPTCAGRAIATVRIHEGGKLFLGRQFLTYEAFERRFSRQRLAMLSKTGADGQPRSPCLLAVNAIFPNWLLASDFNTALNELSRWFRVRRDVDNR
jgi:hypothetical protein